MKYLGSHNSMSYLSVEKKWMKFVNFITRCQSKNYIEQYISGVRIFDVRIKWDEEAPEGFKWRFAHGKVSYVSDVHELMRFLNSKNDCWVRLILEYNKEPRNSKDIVEKFTDDCFHFKFGYPNIKFFEFRCKWNWARVVFDEYQPTLDQQVGSMQSYTFIGKFWPWLWAKLNNRRILKRSTTKDILLMDFI